MQPDQAYWNNSDVYKLLTFVAYFTEDCDEDPYGRPSVSAAQVNAMAKISGMILRGLAFAAGVMVATSAPARADLPRMPSQGQEYFGVASWYGPGFGGQRTANGEKFNPKALTAAHPSLPFGTLVEVSRANGKKSVVVVITDRGPYVGGRAIDLSRAAARKLSMSYLGTTPVKIQVIGMVE